jgi:hypothetical protein
MFSRFVLTVLGIALAASTVFLAVADGGEEERGRRTPADDTTRHHDPVATVLPFPVIKTYRALFPGHQIWQVSQAGKENDAEFELIIFHPKTSSSQGQQVGRTHVTTLMHYKLLLKGTGEVIREQAHPIAEDAVPKVVKDAVDRWKRPLQGRTFSVEWLAHQEVGAERLYSIYIELTAIEAYRATLRTDGTFVKGAKAFEKYRSKNP